ncbi:MAG: PP2C family protein-serine/threonine phosphatase [Bacteroidetes bacterium]|nr:PP2C family protein-serine/threonine phosphatase [Bacteroidota bacterium]
MIEKKIQLLEQQNQLKEIQLNSLLEITKEINENGPVDQLIRIFTFILKEQLGFSKIVFIQKQDSWNTLIKIGIKGKIPQNELSKSLIRFKEITMLASSNSEFLNEFQAVVPVIHEEKPLSYLLISKSTISSIQNSDSLNLQFIQTISNIISVAIENKSLAKKSLVQERINKELEVAREMQKLLFPTELPTNKKLDISARYIPRHAIGGDYYDFIPLGDEEYIMCIADVSGKGISAALLMANFQATIRTVLKYQNFELPFLMEELNKKVVLATHGEKFITFFIAHYNGFSRELKYVNAGHNHPILYENKNILMLESGCTGLGMLDELPTVKVGNLKITPNSSLILYTDGIVELENEEGEQFGLERLIQNVETYSNLSMEDMNSIVFSKLEEWKGKQKYDDDTAIFSCKFF